jgi:hypothetical protein
MVGTTLRPRVTAMCKASGEQAGQMSLDICEQAQLEKCIINCVQNPSPTEDLVSTVSLTSEYLHPHFSVLRDVSKILITPRTECLATATYSNRLENYSL